VNISGRDSISGAEGGEKAEGEGAADGEAVGMSLDERMEQQAVVKQASFSDVVVVAAEKKAVTPVVRSRKKSVRLYEDELRQETHRQSEQGAALDSVSAVLAKINLLKAYEEEQANRQLSLAALEELVSKLKALGCPVLDKIEKRYADVSESFAGLSAAAAAYKADLDECLSKHKALDEKRLSFAKRAEALNRWVEEAVDAMTEAVEADTTAECDAADAELATIRAELAEKTGRTSVPALFVGGEFLGGCNDGGKGGVMTLDRAGTLKSLLASAGAV